MVAERLRDATQRTSSEEEQVNVETITDARRRRSEKEHVYVVKNSCADEEEITGKPVGVKQQVLMNSRWTTGAGDYVEYFKNLIVDAAQTERKVDLTVESDSEDVKVNRGDWVSVAEDVGIEHLETCACENERVKGLLSKLMESLLCEGGGEEKLQQHTEERAYERFEVPIGDVLVLQLMKVVCPGCVPGMMCGTDDYSRTESCGKECCRARFPDSEGKLAR